MSRARRRRFRASTTLFAQGDESRHVLVVTSGRCKVVWCSDDGQEALLGVRGPGDILGDMSALDGQPRSASVVALEPVEAAVLTTGEFESFLLDHPRVAIRLLRQIVGRLREADRSRAEFGTGDTNSRLSSLLVDLSERFGVSRPDGVHIDVALSQEDLGNSIGASRRAVANALQELRRQGVVETGRRSIVVTDIERLRRSADR